MIGSRWIVALATLLALMFSIDVALASLPDPYQLGFQEAASDRMQRVDDFHNLVLIIITIITAFVLALLVWVMIRYNSSSNPVASKTSHNTTIEVVWTVLPVIILVVIAVPSFRLLYYLDELPASGADLTIKAIGNQWSWSYEYPDHGNFTFTANMVADKDLKPNQPRLFTADLPLVVPVGKTVRVITTAEPTGVIHSFALPAFGVKIDAVPGRLNETWFHALKEGVFYGQCSELCGANHAYMPIELHVVSEAEFNRWIAEAQSKFARADGPVSVAAVEAPVAQTR